MNEQILLEASHFASEIIKRKHRSVFEYHNLDHTLQVYKVALSLGKELNLSNEQLIQLGIAALFHDSGYYDNIDEHEKLGAANARRFLEEKKVEDSTIQEIEELILHTNIHSTPRNLLDEVIRDADLHYLGSHSYFQLAASLRNEWKHTRDKSYTDLEWTEQNIRFLSNHSYFTEVAKTRYLQTKINHIEQLKVQLNSSSGTPNR